MSRVIGRPFKKGQSGNPKGKPPLPKEVLELRRLTRGDVELKVLKYKQMTQNQLKAVVADSKTPAEDILVIRCILKGIATGDTQALGFLTDFIFGKKPEKLKMDLSSKDGTMKTSQVVIMIPPEDGK